MTIIQPNRRTFSLNIALVAMVCLVLAGAVVSVLLYNSTVSLKDAIARAEQELETLEAENADVRNALYTLLDPQRLREAALELGFAVDATPVYLETRGADLAAGL